MEPRRRTLTMEGRGVSRITSSWGLGGHGLRNSPSMPVLSNFAQAASNLGRSLEGPASPGAKQIRQEWAAATTPDFARPAHSSLPHEGFSAKNPIWARVQQAIMAVFQQKELPVAEITNLCTSVRNLAETDLGPFIYDYYKNQLLPRGLRILRDKVDMDNEFLLESLSEVWDIFYKNIVPLLQMVLHSIQMKMKDLNIRQVSLIGFRDTVLMRTKLEEFLGKTTGDEHPAIQQMLLILQGVPDTTLGPPNDNFLRLEKMVARVVVPYLGYRGLYQGGPEPAHRACRDQPSIKGKPLAVTGLVDAHNHTQSPVLRKAAQRARAKATHTRQVSTGYLDTLGPVEEEAFAAIQERHGRERRYSCTGITSCP